MKNLLAKCAPMMMMMIALTFLLASAAQAKDVTLLEGLVYDKIFEGGIAGAKIVLTDKDTKGSTIFSAADGSYFEKVKIGETHTIYYDVYSPYYPYYYWYTGQYDVDNILNYQVFATGYYPSSLQVDLRNQTSTVNLGIPMELIKINDPFLIATAACKVNDDLFQSDGRGCIDVKQHLRYGSGSPVPMTFLEAVAYCNSLPGISQPNAGALETIRSLEEVARPSTASMPRKLPLMTRRKIPTLEKRRLDPQPTEDRGGCAQRAGLSSDAEGIRKLRTVYLAVCRRKTFSY